MTRRIALLVFLIAALARADDLRIDFRRESLTGTHIHYQQYIDGVPVIGGERIENLSRNGRRDVYQNLAHHQLLALSATSAAAPHAGEVVYLNENGRARLASRVIVAEGPYRRFANYYDAATGALIRSDALFWAAKQGRVFDPNPVTKLNNPDLQDDNGSAAAVPDAAYSIVDLPDLAASGPLSGPYVQIVALIAQHPPLADASQPLLFDRSQPGFQEVNAYYHIDRSQRYLQSLGYVGPLLIAGYAIPTDAHGTATDDSYFVSGFTPGRGQLVFGDGGTDDAEDDTILLHEYGHAIQESIAPGAWGGTSSSQSRALAEGSADYWAFSSAYEQSLASGFDPFCIGPWDARCWKDDPSQFCGYPVGATCLRRVDGSKTMSDFINSDAPGTEHLNGEIWSSALREFFIGMTQRYGIDPGKRLADTVVLEGMFGIPGSPTYGVLARKLLDADRALDGGADVSAICGAMTSRGILAPADCLAPPRGEVTWFQSADRGVTASSITSTLSIADTRPISSLSLNVSVAGVPADDLTVSLLGPDGTSAFLKNSFDGFRGHPAAGTWTLTVRTNDSAPATLVSWNLAIQFEGDQPAASRPTATGSTATIAAVAHAAGANGTNFISDVRILNRGSSSAHVVAIFTPSGADGRSDFAAIQLVIAPSEIVSLDDIVQTAMHVSGLGQLQFSGDVAQLLISSRTYTRGATGTFGQSIPGASADHSIGSGDAPTFIAGLENTSAFRANIGFAEIAGSGGEVHVRYYNAGGNVAGEATYAIAPFSHQQSSVSVSGEALRAEVTVSGAARVLAYGSVVDNFSGDATFIPASRELEGLIPAIHSPGVNGTAWRTDVWLSNVGTMPQAVTLPAATVTISPGGSAVARDVLGGTGQTLLSFSSPDVLVTSRTYSAAAAGTFGQFIAPDTTSTDAATLLGVENDAAFRTNLGVMAPSPSVVRFIAYDSAGNEVWRSDVAAVGLTQFPLPVALAFGRVTAEVLSGGGVVPYASVVDNGSGDPTYINAVR